MKRFFVRKVIDYFDHFFQEIKYNSCARMVEGPSCLVRARMYDLPAKQAHLVNSGSNCILTNVNQQSIFDRIK